MDCHIIEFNLGCFYLAIHDAVVKERLLKLAVGLETARYKPNYLCSITNPSLHVKFLAQCDKKLIISGHSFALDTSCGSACVPRTISQGEAQKQISSSEGQSWTISLSAGGHLFAV